MISNIYAVPGLFKCSRKQRPILITGGAGFIGTNMANRLLQLGRHVLIYDNLSRPGVEENLTWLQELHGEKVEVILEDISNVKAVTAAVNRAAAVFHFAAQVAVTTSLNHPVRDFNVNACGTLNILEALRAQQQPPPLLFTSTHKVYGSFNNVTFDKSNTRYLPPAEFADGVSEQRSLDFNSPHGCSKGAAEQYVLDYARVYGIPAVVFRMSCIYGSHQCGTQDQGWVTHFVLQTLKEEGLVLYGDGLQVRDILYVEDLIDAMLMAMEHIDAVRAQAFNIGGGAQNSISLLELLQILGTLNGGMPYFSFQPWREGDQRYYISDTRHFETLTGWHPTVSVKQGLQRLYAWLAKQPPFNQKPSASRKRFNPVYIH